MILLLSGVDYSTLFQYPRAWQYLRAPLVDSSSCDLYVFLLSLLIRCTLLRLSVLLLGYNSSAIFVYWPLVIVSGYPPRHLCMIRTRDICCEALRAQLNAVLPCNHVFHHCCVADILRHAIYNASSGRAAVDCKVCGSPAIGSLLLTLGYTSDDKPCPCQVQAMHTESGAGNEEDGGHLEPWHMIAHRQDVRGG